MKWSLVIFGSTNLLELSYVLGGTECVGLETHAFQSWKTKVQKLRSAFSNASRICLELLPHETPKDVGI